MNTDLNGNDVVLRIRFDFRFEVLTQAFEQVIVDESRYQDELSITSNLTPAQQAEEDEIENFNEHVKRKALLEYIAHLLDSGYVHGPQPIGPVIVDHRPGASDPTRWLVCPAPFLDDQRDEQRQKDERNNLEPPGSERSYEVAYVTLTSPWFVLSQIDLLVEQLGEVARILRPIPFDRNVWGYPHDGWVDTHWSCFPAHARFGVGFSTAALATVVATDTSDYRLNNGPLYSHEDSWPTAQCLFAIWGSSEEDLERMHPPKQRHPNASEAKTVWGRLQWSNADEPRFRDMVYDCQDLDAFGAAIGFGQSPQETQRLKIVFGYDMLTSEEASEEGENHFYCDDTVWFNEHQPTLDAERLDHWIRFTAGMYCYAQHQASIGWNFDPGSTYVSTSDDSSFLGMYIDSAHGYVPDPSRHEYWRGVMTSLGKLPHRGGP